MFSFLANIFTPLTRRIEVLGIGRLFQLIKNIHGEDLHIISDTVCTEDLHFHAPSGQLFGASEADKKTRQTWFPPLTIWNDAKSIGQGSFVVIDATTLATKRLALLNFEGPFNTHGIDIYPEDDPTSIFIVAVNHLPNPDYYSRPTSAQKDSDIPRARSRLEIFHHKIGTSEAIHIRSIWHPLIRTPNDVLFNSLDEIYITNDHFHREGLLRLVEEVSYGSIGQQTDLVHLRLAQPLSQRTDDTDVRTAADDDTSGVAGTVANKIDMNNGLGRGRDPSDIAVCSATSGQLLLAEVDEDRPPSLKISETIQLPCTLDNPSYFSDPYVSRTGRDASGYVLAGLARAILFPGGPNAVMVWLVQPIVDTGETTSRVDGQVGRWARRLVFQDDGNVIQTASTAVLVAIDPDTNQGKKQARLFITGPLADGIVAVTIDL
ncbi:hypothetical protein VPNG_09503 [Cytospora leucostoma]|uniref:SMP-30/Gluconolactonase/LRE-like region domain-containing protein n=1 Tax=Cytospora leucostoma TaxID=1230097 RepID=A0A423VS18_9PEZI|nr:hypothetical protein VPNG_09503 [Cytospora leucostoma]